MKHQESPNTGASRQILYIGGGIGIGWLMISIASYFVPWEAFRPYGLGSEEGFLPVKLMSYSFVHRGIEHVVFDLLLLWGIVNISRSCLTTDAFIRAYSLGTVGGGLVFLWVISTIGERFRFAYPDLPPMEYYGGFLGLQTMLAAFAVFRPDLKVHFLGGSAAQFIKQRLGWIIVILVIVYVVDRRSFDLYLIVDFLLSYGLIFWVSLEARKVRFIAFLLIIPWLIFSAYFLIRFPDLNATGFSYRIAALIAGVIYGALEKWFGKHAKSTALSKSV